MVNYGGRIVTPTPNQPGPVRIAWLNEAYSLFKQDAGQWILGLVIAGGVWMVAYFVSVGAGMVWFFMAPAGSKLLTSPTPPTSPFAIYTPSFIAVFAVAGFVMMIIQAVFTGGLAKMAVSSVRGEPIKGTDVFQGFAITLPTLLVTLLLALPSFILLGVLSLGPKPTTIGGILGMEAVIYGVLILVAVFVYPLVMPVYVLLADGKSTRQALSRSIRGMGSAYFPAVGVSLLFNIAYLASAMLTCLVATTVTMPMFFLLCAIASRERCGLEVSEARHYRMMHNATGAWPAPTADPGVWPPAPVHSMPQASVPAQTVWPPADVALNPLPGEVPPPPTPSMSAEPSSAAPSGSAPPPAERTAPAPADSPPGHPAAPPEPPDEAR